MRGSVLRKVALSSAVAVLGIGGGSALAAGPAHSPTDASNVIHGCWTNAALNGTHAFVLQDTGSTCPKGTTAISWNQAGPAGAAGPQGVRGLNGTNGASVLNGSGAPAAALGSDGDFYLDTSAALLYGPKTNGSWPQSGTTLVGPQGNAGAAGPTGPKGDTGAAGPAGESAFQVWQNNGHPDGTESDFLASLQGPSGPAGSGATGGHFDATAYVRPVDQACAKGTATPVDVPVLTSGAITVTAECAGSRAVFLVVDSEASYMAVGETTFTPESAGKVVAITGVSQYLVTVPFTHVVIDSDSGWYEFNLDVTRDQLGVVNAEVRGFHVS